jgi:hypothetical protein
MILMFSAVSVEQSRKKENGHHDLRYYSHDKVYSTVQTDLDK